ncbi:hypothetical protein [Enterobacter kobei]|uniref:hypothetical protein n=1 Tax=Enterobacter kobei TaxID=208224 RepID=UPI0032AEC2E5
MSVKRYEWVACDEHSCHCDVVESAEGDMVDYEDYAALEARCAALVAENAGLKKFCEDAAFYADYEAELGMERGGFTDALNNIKTPATDAFLAEVRAQGADECVRQLVISDDDDFSDAPNICAMVAHQLRKGVQS